MASNIGLNISTLYRPLNFNTANNNNNSTSPAVNNNTDEMPATGQANGNYLLNSLMLMAQQNGFDASSLNGTNSQTTAQQQNTGQIGEMLQAGKKEDVKKMGAQAVPALTALVKDTSQPMQVRIDAIATLAKLVDEGKAPASCLVQLLKDPNCKDMAERALANVGKEAMPAVKQLLKSGDPAMQASAKNILNDMKDAWAGYENDPKWGQECQELIPEVDKLLGEVNKTDNDKNETEQGNNKDQAYARQYVDYSKFSA